MPIEVEGGPLRLISQNEFQELDYAVMGIVFQIHNQFGRLLDEWLYKRELASRCRASGISAEREVRVFVTHRSFAKEYKIDLLFHRSTIYELKTVERLAPSHEIQTLNYLLLTGTNHGKLVNLRPDRVEWRFVSTHLTPELRHRFTIDDSGWRDVNLASQKLKQWMLDLLNDWGAFLDFHLYREALTHFLGGAEAVIQPVLVYSDDREIGYQDVHLATEDTAFAVSELDDSDHNMRTHLSRLLAHTRLRHLQWINLNHHVVQFATLTRH
jgi:GxxExxY protein